MATPRSRLTFAEAARNLYRNYPGLHGRAGLAPVRRNTDYVELPSGGGWSAPQEATISIPSDWWTYGWSGADSSNYVVTPPGPSDWTPLDGEQAAVVAGAGDGTSGAQMGPSRREGYSLSGTFLGAGSVGGASSDSLPGTPPTPIVRFSVGMFLSVIMVTRSPFFESIASPPDPPGVYGVDWGNPDTFIDFDIAGIDFLSWDVWHASISGDADEVVNFGATAGVADPLAANGDALGLGLPTWAVVGTSATTGSPVVDVDLTGETADSLGLVVSDQFWNGDLISGASPAYPSPYDEDCGVTFESVPYLATINYRYWIPGGSPGIRIFGGTP